MKRAVDQWWTALQASRPEPAIFWQFIEDERNRTVKLYDYWVERWLDFDGPPIIDGKQLFIRVAKARSRGGGVESSGGRVTSTISRSPFKGIKERDVALRALAWWRAELDKIDATAGSLASGT